MTCKICSLIRVERTGIERLSFSTADSAMSASFQSEVAIGLEC